MLPDEIADLYNFVFKAGNGLRHDQPMANIGGMAFKNETWTFAGRTGYAVGRVVGEDRLWSVTFKLFAATTFRDQDAVAVYHRGTRAAFRYGGKRKVMAQKTGRLEKTGISGSYDAYQHDAALLRMFESEWRPGR